MRRHGKGVAMVWSFEACIVMLSIGETNPFMEAYCFTFGPFVLIPQRQVLLKGDMAVRIGTRALDILTLLVQRPGEVINKQEIISQVWQGTFVDESNLKVNIAAIRKAIDDDDSHRSCIATAIGRGYRFVEAVQKVSIEGPTSLSNNYSALPGYPEKLIGRESIVSQLATQLYLHRLVTVVGSPGIGKTSVAIAAAVAFLEQHECGACFVDLSNVNRHGSAAETVANALGLEGEKTNIEQRLITHLRNRELLMILDSCECAIDNVAALVELIISSCLRVHVLATSRETLRANVERVCRLPGLGIPPTSVRMIPAEVRSYPAVQLFLERSAESLDDCSLTASEAMTIASICEELDGVPLAIELAAMLVRTLGFARLPFTATEQFFTFNTGRRTSPLCHQSLAAALDRSFDLLPDNERSVLSKLSLLDGCFSLEVGIVAARDGIMSGVEITACIANLVSKSLVERLEKGEATFRVLNCIRFYAARTRSVNGKVDVYGEDVERPMRTRLPNGDDSIAFSKCSRIEWSGTVATTGDAPPLPSV